MDIKHTFEGILAALKAGTGSLRTGRATPALVEDIEVEAYGSKQPLKALAAISSPEPRQIVIQPWDKSTLPAIEKAIQSANALGVNPIADKDTIRISLPTLTEERKVSLIKLLKEKLEQSRIHIRKVRDEAMKEVEAEEKSKKISEDEKFRKKQDIEKMVGEYNKKAEELASAKEREIMSG